MALPSFLQSCLWSYDLSQMDKDRDKKLIIAQIINYGNASQQQWMHSSYSDQEIKDVVTHPRRGIWWRDKLRWWLNKYKAMIDPLRFEVAIREIRLRPVSLMAEFFQRADREKHEVARRYS